MIGCIGTAEIAALPRSDWSRLTVDDLMRACAEEEITTPDADALQAMTRMGRTRPSRLFVTENDRLVGVLSQSDLAAFLAVKLDLERPRSVAGQETILVRPT